MDMFISRKKRKISSEPIIPKTIDNRNHSDDESTDYKLAILSSLHPNLEQPVLLDFLLAQNGSVERASTSLGNLISLRRSPGVNGSTGYQSSLTNVTASDIENPTKPKLRLQKGKTLHLYSPEDVAAHTPCSIIHNFLPANEAKTLLEELLEESKTFERMTFKLFDNLVQSPHTACFYVESHEEMQRQKTEYIYNGESLSDVRQLTSRMLAVSPRVGAAVNDEIAQRIATYQNGKRLKYQSPHQWRPNAAFVNCYNGPKESVGYHSDQLTYLGPRATIGSLSLGVAREFRVRRVLPHDEKKSKRFTEDSDAAGQIAIHLPHNSLLVMHAPMQEEWKHSIAPALVIEPHPVAGNRRINITYRDYKVSLHPRFTPRCRCDVPTVLRVVQRKKQNYGKYFWACHAGYVPGKKGCDYFEWAAFDDNGEPLWRS